MLHGGLKTLTYLLAVAVALLNLYCTVLAGNDVRDQVIERVSELLGRLEPLSRDGMDTRAAEYYINQALDILDSGCYKAECMEWIWGNLSVAEKEISRLEGEYPRYTTMRSLVLWATVAVLAMTPLLVYLFLPRLWAYAWYLARRRWVVEKRGGRKK